MALFDIELKRELNATLRALFLGMECERAGQVPGE